MLALGIGTVASGAPARRPLNAREIRQVFSDHVVTDGAHWSYHLKRDGSVDAVDMGRPRTGRWHVDANDQLCVQLAARTASDDCWNVVRQGHTLIFQANGQDLFEVSVEIP